MRCMPSAQIAPGPKPMGACRLCGFARKPYPSAQKLRMDSISSRSSTPSTISAWPMLFKRTSLRRPCSTFLSPCINARIRSGINPGKRFTRESRAPDQVPGAGKRLILRIEAHHVATASFPSPTTTSTSAAWTSCWPLPRLASANGESRAEPYKYYVAFPKTLCL